MIERDANGLPRREAYEQGRYVPTNYGIFVRREAMVRWVKSSDFEGALAE